MNRDNHMEMEDEIAKLKPLLRALAEEAQAQAGEHLTVERLAAYHFKRLSDDEAERTQDHLVMCRECASLLLDLAEFCALDQEETGRPLRAEPGTAESARQSSFQIESQAAPSLFQRLRELIFPRRPIYALAVLSLVLGLSLAVWIVSLKRENQRLIAQLNQEQITRDAEAAREIEEAQRQRDEARRLAEQLKAQEDKLTRPQLNPPIIDLLSGNIRVRGESRLAGAELSASDIRFTLVLPPPERNYPDYEIEIINPSGATVVNERGLRPHEMTSVFTISLPSALFPPGEYRCNVYGIGRGERTRVSGGVARIRYKQ